MKKRLMGVIFMLLFSLCSFTCVNAGYEYYHDKAPSNPNKTYRATFENAEVTGKRNICGEQEIYIDSFPTQMSYSFLKIAMIGSEPGVNKTCINGFFGTDGSFQLKTSIDGAAKRIATFKEDTSYTVKWSADFSNGTVMVKLYEEGEFIAEQEMTLSFDNENPVTSENTVYLTGIDITVERGMGVTIGNQKVYSALTEVSQMNFIDGDEVTTDFLPELTFDAELDSESISEINITDSDGNDIPAEVISDTENASKVKVVPEKGLEYLTQYTVNIPDSVRSAGGVYAKPVSYVFMTQADPVRRELYVAGGAVCFYENNPSPHDYTRYILINTLDENGIITKSEKKTVSVPAGEEVSQEFPAEGTVTAELYDEFKGIEYSGYSEIGLTNGLIDRKFSKDYHLYKITLEADAQLPDIAIDGMTKEVKDDVIVLSDGTSSYRFVVSYETAAPVCSEPAFESDTKVKINTEAEGKTKVLVLPPKSLGADEAYTISEFLVSDSFVADIKCFDTQTMEYVFSEDNISGRYNFYVVSEGSDEIAGPYSAYYASKNDLENCQSEWTALKNSSSTTAAQVDAFIDKYVNILKLDISEYKNLNKQSVSDYLLGSNAVTINDVGVVFKEAVLVVGFNEAANKAQFVATHSEQAGVSVTEDWAADAAGILSSLKAAKPADIAEYVEYSKAIILVNNAEPSGILSAVLNNSEALELTEAQTAKLENTAYKSALVNALTGKGFTDAAQIKDAIDGAGADDNNSTPSNKPSRVPTGGGGGGGGGGGNTVVSYVDPNKNSKEETKDETTGQEETPSETVPGEESVFSDLADVSWAKEAIEYLYNEKIISGNGDGTYRPNDNIKREEFVKILIEALGITHRQESDVFEDAGFGQWYTPYIYSAYTSGIVSGISSTEFGVGVDISRQDIAVMINRAIAAVKLNISDVREISEFSDAENIADYAAESVDSLFAKGILNGNENNEFLPGEKATRAEVAQVIYNLINRINEGEEEQN